MDSDASRQPGLMIVDVDEALELLETSGTLAEWALQQLIAFMGTAIAGAGPPRSREEILTAIPECQRGLALATSLRERATVTKKVRSALRALLPSTVQ